MPCSTNCKISSARSVSSATLNKSLPSQARQGGYRPVLSAKPIPARPIDHWTVSHEGYQRAAVSLTRPSIIGAGVLISPAAVGQRRNHHMRVGAAVDLRRYHHRRVGSLCLQVVYTLFISLSFAVSHSLSLILSRFRNGLGLGFTMLGSNMLLYFLFPVSL